MAFLSVNCNYNLEIEMLLLMMVCVGFIVNVAITLKCTGEVSYPSAPA